ncbi:zinc finger matrin-type protein 3-like [Ptychodera flava]|uniref:zinc finger matrin-type protein 3-like n=1 Tax=Ptychodera flava TaxID=63121 RepID=UPI00396A1562
MAASTTNNTTEQVKSESSDTLSTAMPLKTPGKNTLFEKDFGGSGFVVEESDYKTVDSSPGVGVKRKAESVDPPIEVPPELMEPLHCRLCDIMLNSPPQAQAHYMGKNHQKKVRQYAAQQTLSAKLKVLSPTATSPPDSKVPKVGTDSNSYEYCQLCNVSFTSVVHAKSHYEGKNHTKRLRNQTPVYTKNAYYCCSCNLSLNSESQYDQHMRSKKHANALKKRDGGKDALPVPLPPPGLPPHIPEPAMILAQEATQNGQNVDRGNPQV